MLEGQMSIFDLFELSDDETQLNQTPKKDDAEKLIDEIESLVTEVGGKSKLVEDVSPEDTEESEETETSEEPSETPAATTKASTSTTASSKKGKTSASSVTPKSPFKTEPVIKDVPLSEEWKLRYSGSTYYLQLLFEEEIIAGKISVTLEEIREKLVISDNCIELSPQRAFWEVDEPQKLLVLICKGQSKGGF